MPRFMGKRQRRCRTDRARRRYCGEHRNRAGVVEVADQHAALFHGGVGVHVAVDDLDGVPVDDDLAQDGSVYDGIVWNLAQVDLQIVAVHLPSWSSARGATESESTVAHELGSRGSGA